MKNSRKESTSKKDLDYTKLMILALRAVKLLWELIEKGRDLL